MSQLRVLVTAGSTWIPIDSVRVITNIFKGRLGLEIAQKLNREGFRVTLLLGNSGIYLDKSASDSFNILRFKYYDDLRSQVEEEINKNHYDIVIHSAAISDYKLADPQQGKIKSGMNELILRLVPTEKIVDIFKKINPKVFLVMFKLEVNKKREELIEIAKKSMDRAKADVIVANDFEGMNKKHDAILITRQEIIDASGREEIAEKIFRIIHEHFKN